MAVLKNEFTWSASRRSTFEYCKRQYWWNYYGSWGGWSRDAQPEPRQAYMLKNLANRWTWPGTIVHQRIEAILLRQQSAALEPQLGFESADVDVDAEIESATQEMREQWVESRNGGYRRRPKKSFGLVEHEYDVVLPRSEWQEANQKVQSSLRVFLGSELFGRIRDSDPTTWLPIEKLDKFDFEGTGVWAVLDFAWQLPDGVVEIYDWKTGKVTPEASKLQLSCYALYVGAKHGVEPTEVTTNLIYLGEKLQAFHFQMTESELLDARGQMRASIAAMRMRLQDKEHNIAVREDFPLSEDLEKCSTCAYRRLCGRE